VIDADVNISGDLDMVFNLDPEAWSPRKLVYAQAVQAAEGTGSRIPSPTEVYAALRDRRFHESKRRGVWGFNGIRTFGDPKAPRVKPAGTASAYYHRDERTEAARSAMYATRLSGEWQAGPTMSPWFETQWTAEDRADVARSRRRLGGHKSRRGR